MRRTGRAIVCIAEVIGDEAIARTGQLEPDGRNDQKTDEGVREKECTDIQHGESLDGKEHQQYQPDQRRQPGVAGGAAAQ